MDSTIHDSSSPASAQQDAMVLTQDEADLRVTMAKLEFADDVTRHGGDRDAALKLFDLRVSAWSNRFSTRWRRVAYTIGCMMDGETHERTWSRRAIMNRYAELHDGEPIGESKLTTLQKELRAAGIVLWPENQDRRKSWEEGAHAWKSNPYTVNFARVLEDGKIIPHDFLAPVSPPADDSGIADPDGVTNDGINDGVTDEVNDEVNDEVTDNLFYVSSESLLSLQHHRARARVVVMAIIHQGATWILPRRPGSMMRH